MPDIAAPTPAPSSATSTPAAAAPKAPAAAAPPAPGAPASAKSPLAAGLPQTETPPSEMTPAEKKTYKFKGKVYGQEIEEELDDERLQARLQKGYAFDKTSAETADIRAKFKQLQDLGKQDPITAVKELFGLDFDELAEKRVTEKYRQQLMSEDELKQHQERQEWERIKQENESYKEAEQRRQHEAVQAQVFQRTEKAFKAALEESGLPDTDEVMYEMARVAKINHQHNIQLTPKQLAAEVQASLDARYSKLEGSVSSGLKGEALLKRLGDSVVKEVLRAALEKARGQQSVAPPPPVQKPEDTGFEKTKPRNLMDPAAWRRKHIFGIE